MASATETRGRPSRIQRLPTKIRQTLDALLQAGITQTEILSRLQAPLQAAGEAPLSKAGLSRYATKMEKMGKRIREMREAAAAWSAPLSDVLGDKVSQHIIEILRTLTFELTLNADKKLDEEGKPLLDPRMINDLALALKRIENASEISAKRERELRLEVAKQAEDEVKKLD